MKFFVKDEKGSTLLLVLLMVLIFTVLGMALISSSLSGTKRTIHRESDVQATALAEMGIDYIEEYVATELDALKDADGKIELHDPNNPNRSVAELFQKKLEDILAGINENYTNDGQAYSIEDIDVLLTESDNSIDGTISFTSTGIANGISKTLNTVLKLDAGGTFNVLSYAVGAEGNVFLHGSPTIYGDLYVGNNLYVYDKAHVYSGQDYYIPSVYPCLQSDNSIVGNDIKRIKKITNYQKHIRGEEPGTYTPTPNQNANDQAFLQTTFSCSPPKFEKIMTDFSSIDILGSSERFKILSPDFSGTFRNNFTLNNSFPQSLVRVNFTRNWPFLIINSKQTIGGLHSTNRVIIQQGTDLTLGWQDPNTEQFKGGMYVGGDLYIGNPYTNSDANDVSSYDEISIKGPIYVDGNLYIRGADVKFDSTVYVTGETEIRNSRLRGIENQDFESSLVLFGEDAVKISNISSFENNRDLISKVRGFFYSNSLLEMYGVGSNIEIEGGIFAQDIVLNAIRGNSYDYFVSNYYEPGDVGWYFERDKSQKSMNPSMSRLRIIHNAELIKNPPDALPAVDEIKFKVTQREIQ